MSVRIGDATASPAMLFCHWRNLIGAAGNGFGEGTVWIIYGQDQSDGAAAQGLRAVVAVLR